MDPLNAVHKRFSKNMKWIFPDKNYDYYNFMVRSGYGKKDPELIKQFIKNKKIVNGENNFDISYEFDLIIPDYGIVNGEWWRSQFYEYLLSEQRKESSIEDDDCKVVETGRILSSNFVLKQEIEEAAIEKENVARKLYMYSLEDD